jgi:CheY-like chemotaxis protein
LGEPEKVLIGGPSVSLQPHAAQGLALALHELATNAAKHGALSSISGKVRVTWTVKPDFLLLHWSETGGPTIAPPPARSFGLNVIRASIENQLSGKAIFDWLPEGMQCTLSIPQQDQIGFLPGRKTGNGAAASSAEPTMANCRRVLLVEDEALVAMMIQECLTEYGHSVVGPISRAADALAAAKQGEFDAAILDINLSDGMAYPVAEILSQRGVPFAFVTGYEADTVDERFSEVPVLQKPIERQMLQRLFVPSATSTAALYSGLAKARASN